MGEGMEEGGRVKRMREFYLLALMSISFYGMQRDGKMPSHSGYKWSVPADVESLAWDPHSEHSFVVRINLTLLHSIFLTSTLFPLKLVEF